MKKIMLVIDDFQELVHIESVLKRVGFDVLSIGKEVLLADAIVGFHPDILMASARGRAVDGFRLAPRIKKMTPPPRVALVVATNQTITLTNEVRPFVDALIEAPIDGKRLIQIVAQLAGIASENLLKKYEKLSASGLKSSDGSIRVSDGHGAARDTIVVNGGAASSAQDKAVHWDPRANAGTASTARTLRSDRYEKFLTDHTEEVSAVLPAEAAKKAMEKLRDDSSNEKPALEKIDDEKREFVKVMFTKNKKSS